MYEMIKGFSENYLLLFIVAIFIIGLTIGILIGKIIRFIDIKKLRGDAIKRSKSVILGEVYEKIIPFLPHFPYSPKDMVFIGKGIDYLVLDGLSAGDLKSIIFLEIKSGKSTLNKNEKMIRDTIYSNKVRYEEYRI